MQIIYTIFLAAVRLGVRFFPGIALVFKTFLIKLLTIVLTVLAALVLKYFFVFIINFVIDFFFLLLSDQGTDFSSRTLMVTGYAGWLVQQFRLAECFSIILSFWLASFFLRMYRGLIK